LLVSDRKRGFGKCQYPFLNTRWRRNDTVTVVLENNKGVMDGDS
jgi:hypothetical protein